MPKRLPRNPLDWLDDKAPTATATEDGPAAGTQPTEVREDGAPRVTKSYWLSPELVEKVADVAHAERCGISDFVTQALREYVTRLEKRRGEPYPPRPKGKACVPSTL